jgi:hypothetical protein
MIDHVADADADLFHDRGAFSVERGLHLHRFEHRQRL